MGQAALDLPDPLQSPPQAPQTSTDDLLAQLAGDEIDRLLSEADGGEARAASAPFHVGPATGPGPESQPQAGPAEAPTQAPAEPSVVEEEVTAELDALFSAAVEKDKALEAAQAAAARETTTAERAALTVPAAPTAAQDDDAPLPLYLRPLEWLSAPLMIFPPGVRDLIGKAAIVTLLNAIVILAYVLVVRGR